jgi:hypothetical protein
MAWTFSGVFLDGFSGERVVAGTGDPEELPGRFALAGLVDAHAHPTVAVDRHGPYLAGGEYGAARLEEYAARGVTVIRDTGGRSQLTLGFARIAAAGHPVVTAAGRFLAPANRYFPRMHSPVEPDELAAAIQAEVAAGAAWVKIIGDFPAVGRGRPGAAVDGGNIRRRHAAPGG